MAWAKSSPALVARFDQSLPQASSVERRKMFGYPCAFVNGNMFAGLHEQNLIVRLAQAERERLTAAGLAKPFVVMGKTMREYVVLNAPLAQSDDVLAAHLARAYAFARKLPPKVKKAAKASKAKH